MIPDGTRRKTYLAISSVVDARRLPRVRPTVYCAIPGTCTSCDSRGQSPPEDARSWGATLARHFLIRDQDGPSRNRWVSPARIRRTPLAAMPLTIWSLFRAYYRADDAHNERKMSRSSKEACREASRTVEPLNAWNRVKWLNVFYLTIACCLVTIAYSGMQAVTVISTRSSGSSTSLPPWSWLVCWSGKTWRTPRCRLQGPHVWSDA